MALPSYLIELQFGSSSYIDISQYAQNISISKGISRSLDDYPAGSISITFVNNARIFDPLNTSSPLWYGAGGYTLVQPAGRLRVSSNGIRKFTGFVEDWSFSYDESGLDGKATVTALDEIYRVSNAVFTGGTAFQVEATSDRIKTVMNYNGFSAGEYAGVRGGHTLLGYDINDSGENVLAYLQNVARSEPADFYSDSSAVMQLKDRSFTNYNWVNTYRQNLIKYPNELSQDTTTISLAGGTGLGDGWVYGWQPGTAAPFYAGGTVNTAQVTLATRDFWYQEVDQQKINPSGTATKYVFSGWFRGQGLTGAGISGSLTLLDSKANPLSGAASMVASAATGGDWTQMQGTANYSGTAGSYVFSGYFRGQGLTGAGITGSLALLDRTANVLSSTSMFASAATGNDWTNMRGTATYGGTGIVAGFYVSVSAPGTGTVYNFIANGWQVEQGTVIPNYFDGAYNPFTSSASTAYEIAWAGIPYASQSGLLTSVASAIAAPSLVTFADLNSQGTAYGNGTGIAFTDLGITYGSEQLYNKVQVVGINATAVVEDSASQLLYGLRGYSQTDNLTTSTTKPAEIATTLRGEYRLPEYRASDITVTLNSLSSADQNRVIALDLRDVVRVCFQPSASGSIVDKYYQILAISANADPERDEITFSLASLDNLSFRLDSPFLGVLDTDTLG